MHFHLSDMYFGVGGSQIRVVLHSGKYGVCPSNSLAQVWVLQEFCLCLELMDKHRASRCSWPLGLCSLGVLYYDVVHHVAIVHPCFFHVLYATSVWPLAQYFFTVWKMLRLFAWLRNEKPTWCHLLFYFNYCALNMFRTLIYPPSGACDFVEELPHRSSCSVKTDVLAISVPLHCVVVCLVWCVLSPCCNW